jgi:hypothetical protein
MVESVGLLVLIHIRSFNCMTNNDQSAAVKKQSNIEESE